jgi:hypothetical protein
VITVALDKNAEDARPWIEKATPQHPSLIDTEHRLADLYGMVNVPTIVWVDEGGQIVRPNDVAFATDTYKAITGFDAGKSLAAIRAWVKGETSALSAETVRARQVLPTPQHQLARAEFALGKWLWNKGRTEAAERHFVVADGLAPQDWTIRRGSFPMRNKDSFGPDFRSLRLAWVEAGNKFYLPLAD